MVRRLLPWFGANARDLPWRRTRDPYAIWISEIMLQQTQVKTVVAYWERWMRALPDVAALARAKPARVHKLWEGLGYYARARNAQAAAKIIVDKHGGEFPKAFEEVLALPGVGRYTAGAICSIAYGQAKAILDGNVIRVLSRLFGVAGDPRGKEANARLWGLAQELVSTAAETEECGRLNEGLMELGALVCTPGEPRCPECPVRTLCFARKTKRVGELPMARVAGQVIQRRCAAFVVKKEGRFLVRQRPAGAVNAHLWEFPNVEIAAKEKNPAAGAGEFVLTEKESFCRVRHSITRYRILLEAYHAKLSTEAPRGNVPGVWRTAGQLDRLAFAGAHRKIVAALKAEKSPEKRSNAA
jgi:A/G-specific adenine glycosylase